MIIVNSRRIISNVGNYVLSPPHTKISEGNLRLQNPKAKTNIHLDIGEELT